VRFGDIEGMFELNGPECRPIKIISPNSFAIEDTREFNSYLGGGHADEVKVPKILKFNSLKDSI
jgi:ubiquitin-activating enzyme E1